MSDTETFMGPSRVQRASLRHVVERHILSAIRRGALRPGDRLHESQLAKAVGVSLTPVREALFRLVQAGVIDHQPRQGFFLVDLGPEQLEELVSLRAALEGLAASRAATRIRPDEIQALERVIEEGVRAARAGDPIRNAECNAEFHSLIVEAARHSLLERAWQQITPLRWLLIPAVAPAVDDAWIDDWEARHRGLLAAITSGDPDRAEEASRAHTYISAHTPRQLQARARVDAARERKS